MPIIFGSTGDDVIEIDKEQRGEFKGNVKLPNGAIIENAQGTIYGDGTIFIEKGEYGGREFGGVTVERYTPPSIVVKTTPTTFIGNEKKFTPNIEIEIPSPSGDGFFIPPTSGLTSFVIGETPLETEKGGEYHDKHGHFHPNGLVKTAIGGNNVLVKPTGNNEISIVQDSVKVNGKGELSIEDGKSYIAARYDGLVDIDPSEFIVYGHGEGHNHDQNGVEGHFRYGDDDKNPLLKGFFRLSHHKFKEVREDAENAQFAFRKPGDPPLGFIEYGNSLIPNGVFQTNPTHEEPLLLSYIPRSSNFLMYSKNGLEVITNRDDSGVDHHSTSGVDLTNNKVFQQTTFSSGKDSDAPYAFFSPRGPLDEPTVTLGFGNLGRKGVQLMATHSFSKGDNEHHDKDYWKVRKLPIAESNVISLIPVGSNYLTIGAINPTDGSPTGIVGWTDKDWSLSGMFGNDNARVQFLRDTGKFSLVFGGWWLSADDIKEFVHNDGHDEDFTNPMSATHNTLVGDNAGKDCGAYILCTFHFGGKQK